MSDSPKSSKPLVLGVVGAVVLAAIAGGYYVGVNTYKSKMQTQVTKIVNDANTASKTYLNGDFVLKSEKDESTDSFSHDRYVFKVFNDGDDKEFLSIIHDNSYGLTSVDTDIKFKFNTASADDPEVKELLTKLEQSLSGVSTFSALGKKYSTEISLTSNKFEKDGNSIEWGKGKFGVKDLPIESSGLATFAGALDSLNLKVADPSSPMNMSLNGLNFEADSDDAVIKFDKLSFDLGKDNASIDKWKTEVKAKNDFSQKKSSVDFQQSWDKLFVANTFTSLWINQFGDLKIEKFNSDLQFNDMNVATVLDKCKLENNAEGWAKISSCMQDLKGDDAAAVVMSIFSNANGLWKIGTKVNDSAVKLDLNFKVNGEVKEVFSLMKQVSLKVNLNLDKNLFDNVKPLAQFKELSQAYLVPKGDQLEAVLECSEAKCNLNGNKLF